MCTNKDWRTSDVDVAQDFDFTLWHCGAFPGLSYRVFISDPRVKEIGTLVKRLAVMMVVMMDGSGDDGDYGGGDNGGGW